MVSVMIFSVVMTVALGALLAMSHADQRAEAVKSVVNNLNFALDSMSRTIRTGYNYHCGTSGSDFSTPAPQNCSGAGGSQTYLAFRAADGTLKAYCLDAGVIKWEEVTSGSLGTNCSAADFYPLTADSITITSLQFIVTGAAAGDAVQPKVTLLLSGEYRVSATQTTQFNLQTSITQRIYDQ